MKRSTETVPAFAGGYLSLHIDNSVDFKARLSCPLLPGDKRCAGRQQQTLKNRRWLAAGWARQCVLKWFRIAASGRTLTDETR